MSGFKIEAYHTNSPKNFLTKTLTDHTTYRNCVLRDGCSLINPVILVNTGLFSKNDHTYNYVYISDFQRYYFVTDIVSVKNNLWEVSLHVDVLMSFKSDILTTTGIVSRQQNSFNTYLTDSKLPLENNTTTTTLTFKSGNFDTAGYIVAFSAAEALANSDNNPLT